MPDNKDDRGPADQIRIDTSEDYELRYWAEKFGVSHDRLREVVNKVGPMAVDVEKELDQ